MAQYEIEMKARIHDPDSLLRRMAELGATKLADYCKNDAYYHLGLPDGTLQAIRLRTDGGRSWLTFKDRTLRDGLEVNVEHETLVEKPEVVEELLSRMGARMYVRKEKTGSAWEYHNLLLELSLVSGLGWFLELEYVVDSPASGAEAEANKGRSLIMEVMAELGIDQADIESRTYTSMLLAASSGSSP